MRMTREFLLVLLSIAFISHDAPSQEPDRVVRLLEELTNAPGPSGFEAPVREIVERELRAAGADIAHDGLGSLVAKIGPDNGPRIMVTAHLDEVGLKVQYIRPDGFIRFKTLGGWLNQALVDQRWLIVGNQGPVVGITGIRTVHVTRGDARNRVWTVEELFIDVGARSRADVEAMGIRPGDPIAPWSPFTILSNDRYAAKAWGRPRRSGGDARGSPPDA